MLPPQGAIGVVIPGRAALDSQITTALIALGLTVIGALGTLVKVMVDQISRKLEENTKLTKETKAAANGQLTNVIDQLAAERNTVAGLRMVVRERDDRIAYLMARLPQAESLMHDYSERRTARSSEADVIAAEKHLLSE
jgi:hypothetical protein